LCPLLSAAIEAKSAVAAWKLCGSLTETDTAGFGDLCIKSRACTKVGARNPLVFSLFRPTHKSDYPIFISQTSFKHARWSHSHLNRPRRVSYLLIAIEGPRACTSTAEICEAARLLTMQCERGFLPCVWVTPGRHASWSEETCRVAPPLSSSVSHFNARLEARNAPLALAPRMDSFARGWVEQIHSPHTRRFVQGERVLLALIRYGHSLPDAIRLPVRLRIIHLAYDEGTSSQVHCHIDKDYTSYIE